MPTSANATGIRGKITPLMCQGKICKSCGRPIEAEQPARRRGETDWAHDVCPVITG